MAVYTAIDDPEAYFQARAYTGNGSADTSITFDGDTDLEPDLLWIKRSDTSFSHLLFDSVRGITKRLITNSTAVESTESTIASFDSDGWTMDADTANNADGGTYAAWCWKESATAGFDIVAYTGTGSATTVSHSLSALPHWIILKARDRAGPDWLVFGDKIHTTPHDAIVKLNNTTALNSGLDSSWFNDTNPTSSVFSVGTQGDLNADGSTYITYLFTSIQGYSKFGSYTGNGSDDGPFIYTGFKPAYATVKASSRTGSWCIHDNKRPGYNPENYPLFAEDAGAQDTSDDRMDLLSNGFKMRDGDATSFNESGATYIYAAFAEAPFVNSEGVPCNAR